MNKKFLSAILFGALVATTGSFVSCADDSSDVNGLQEQIDALSAQFNKQIATLQVELNAALDAAKAAQNAADQAVAEAKAQNIQEVMDQLEAYIAEQGFATSEELSKIAAKLEALNLNELEVKISDLEAKLAALDLQNDVLDAYSNLVGQVGENASTIQDLQNQIAVLSALIANNDTADLAAKLEALEAAINAMNPSLNVIGAEVSSIVFNPSLYMDGIEAQEYIYLMYQPILPVSNKNVGPYKAADGFLDEDSYVQHGGHEQQYLNGYDAKWQWETSQNYVGVFYRNTDVINEVNYYVNPANASVSLDNFALQGKDVMLVTRATPASTVGYKVDYADYIKEHNINTEYGTGFKAEVEQQAGQKVLKVTVPYTAVKAYEAGLEYARYNANNYYNTNYNTNLPAVKHNTPETKDFALVSQLSTTTTWPGATKFAGVNRKGSVYSHDLDELDHELMGHENTECQDNNGHVDNGCTNSNTDHHDYDWGTESCDEGMSNIFQLQAQLGEDNAVVSDWAMLYASPITPIAIAFTDKNNVNGHKVITANAAPDCATDLHLFRTMQEAIEQPASLQVKYYGDQIDLKTFLEVHVNRYSKIARNTNTHNKWGYYQIERYGLNWNYELVDWNHSDQVAVDEIYAHQSQFADPELAKNGIIKPRKINVNGSTNTAVETEKKDRDIIGKEPIIKVTVTDSNNNDAIVLIGFIKVTIIERLENLNLDLNVRPNPYTITCENYVTDAAFHTVWNEYQFYALDSLADLSYEEFNALYKLDTDADGHAIQFVNYQSIGTDCAVDLCPRGNAARVGIVTSLENNEYVGDNDNGLLWQLSACQMRKLWWSNKDANGVAHVTVTVRYVRKDERYASKDPIFVTLNLDIKHPFQQVGSVTEKIVDYWYAVDDANVSRPELEYQTPNDGVRANVQEPFDYSNSRNFYYSLTSAWYGNEIQFHPSADGEKVYDPASPYYANYTLRDKTSSDRDYRLFYFHPANNKVNIGGFQLSVESDKVDVACSCNQDVNNWNDGHMSQSCPNCGETVCPTKVTGNTAADVIANLQTLESQYYIIPTTTGTVYSNTTVWVSKGGVKEVLCTLDQTTGKIQYNWEAPDNTLAKQLLNKYDHHVAEEFVYVGVYGINKCGYVKPVILPEDTDNVYPVHFLRPLTGKDGDPKNLSDAHHNGSYFDVIDLFGNLTDWRDSLFIPRNVWYFKYYNVKDITVDLPMATTDLNTEGQGSGLNPESWTKKLVDVSREVEFYHYGYHTDPSDPNFRKIDSNNLNSFVAQRGQLTKALIFDYTSDPYNWIQSDPQDELLDLLRLKFGALFYKNNRGNVDPFYIYVPVRLTYDWGVVADFHILVLVNPTEGNN